ncbi:S9 family peptidase [Salmonirosea aquatica]|uniref:S9 family peptidase n=1 Tax=Salmonirosea aquatica TaxID=2654236 RepID=UPI00357114BC
MQKTILSNDGQWVAYEINPQEGDGELVVEAPATGRRLNFSRGYGAQFSADGTYLIAKIKPALEAMRVAKKQKLKPDKMPKDSLIVVKLADGQQRSYANVASFKVGEDGGNWLAFLTKKEEAKKDTTQKAAKPKKPKKLKGDLLTVQNMDGTETFLFENVGDYAISDQGNRILLAREWLRDTTIVRGVYAFTVRTKATEALDSSSVVEVYTNLTLDKPGGQGAWMSSLDSAKAEVKSFSLFLRDFSKKNNVLVADSTTKALPTYYTPSEYRKPRFSDDGSRLYFGAAPLANPSLKDTTMLDDELSRVDVWTWNDKRLQPMQDKQRKEMLEKNYWAVYEVNSKKVIQLGSEILDDVDINFKLNNTYLLAKSNTTYQKMSSWEPGHTDLYVINALTGQNSLVAQDVLGRSEMSPTGKYVVWFDERDTLWKAYDRKMTTLRNLTKELNVAFYDEEHDTPDTPNSYGLAGWTPDDRYLLVYDRYDLWRLDPTGQDKPLNVTNGYGRREKVQLRYLKVLEDADFIDPSASNLLHGLWEKDKETGILSWKSGADPTVIIKEAYSYLPNSVAKAKKAEVYVFQKGNYAHPNELYYVKDWKQPQKLTNLAAQTDGILWGTSELVSWVSSQGVTLEGLLFKPENFDPNKKYPMLVYYYERNASSLHAFRAPAPSRSTINIPYCVSNGYLVFVPDIVYGGGTPGKNAYDCIVSGVLDLVDRGFVDRKNIGIQGQSWGGYQTAYLITQTNLFKAAMAGAIVANMTSAYGGIRWGTGLSRMFQYEKTQSRIGGTLWEKPLYYIENSPLFYADRVETPVLLMHNDADGSVPWYQGIEFFTALRRLNKPVWMLVYNDEDHNLTKRPNMKDLSIRMYQFFDHYLKNAPMPSWMSEGRTVIEKQRWDMKYD